MTSLSSRRVGAIYLPHLSCELVHHEHDAKDFPLAVVEAQKESRPGEEAELGNVLSR